MELSVLHRRKPCQKVIKCILTLTHSAKFSRSWCLSLILTHSIIFYSIYSSPGLTLSALAVSDNGNFVATGSMSEVNKENLVENSEGIKFKTS